MANNTTFGGPTFNSDVGFDIGFSDDKKAFTATFSGLVVSPCQRQSKNASAGRSKNTSVMLAGRPRNWGLLFRHQAWVGLSTDVSEVARCERRLL
jgi:hypothetical protein